MDLWATLGISPQVGLIVAAAGVLAAVVLAGTLLARRSRAEKAGFHLAAALARESTRGPAGGRLDPASRRC